jgi:hypothetical protein
MGMGEILPPEFGVLLVGKVKSDFAGLALNHHLENLPVLGHLYPTGALGELDQRFIAVKSGSARQRRTGQRTVAAAAAVLAVSERQAYRLLARYERDGGSGLIHKARGRTSNRSRNEGIRKYAVELVKTKYADISK